MTAIQLVNKLAEIDEGDLTRLSAGRSFYVSAPWLRAYEHLRGPDVAYVTHRDGAGRLDGLLPIYRQRPGTLAPYDAFSGFLCSAGDFRAEDWSPNQVLGQSAAYSNEFLIDAATPRGEAEILEDLLLAADERRREWGVPATSALYLNEAGARQFEAARGPAGSFVCDVECEVDIEWDSWDGYVEYLHSLGRKRSAAARRETQVFAEAGYDISALRLSELLDTSSLLFTKLQRKYGDSTSLEERTHYLRVLVSEVDDHSHLFVMRSAGEVLGVCLTFLWGDTVYVRQLGLDYEHLADASEYFNLAIYEPIRYAIEHSYARVHFGRASYDAKMFRGAKARPLLGAAWSDTAASPQHQPAFRQWNDVRRHAAASGDRSLVLATFGPST
ncbi:GNAT family N-acetyltransferase [Streptomyces sp. NPDC059696]|uniref:GNAT family N-acetyltransferase n=1 Tax=Streptomyces sp. NPDC059696 TaxID=3346911 RepID=UPI00368D6CE9